MKKFIEIFWFEKASSYLGNINKHKNLEKLFVLKKL